MSEDTGRHTGNQGMGKDCQWEKERQREIRRNSPPPLLQPPTGQFVAAQGSLGINWSSDTPFGNTKLVLNHSFQVTKGLPTSPQGAGDKHTQKRGYLAHHCNPITNPDVTPLWFIPTGSAHIRGWTCTTSLRPWCLKFLPASPTALATVPQPSCM